MIEKNRDILSKAIKNMGKRSPEASSWDNIAAHLDQLGASEFSKVKNDLPVRRAPANAWEQIAKALPPAHFSFLGSLTGKVISGVVIVAAITAGYWLLPEKDDEEVVKKVEVSNPIVREAEDKVAVDKAFSDTDDARKQVTVPDLSGNLKVFTRSNQVSAQRPAQKSFEKADPSPVAMDKIAPLPSLHINSASFTQDGLNSRDERKTRDITPAYFDDSRYQMQYSAGAYYAFSLYQQVETSGMQTPDKLSSYGIELKFEKHKWFLKTGVEYFGWEEKGAYNIDYSQNQLVYQYNYVDSANINTLTGEISYFTTERDVYDSLPGQLSDEAAYQYRMLNIPVLFGYKIIDHTRFSLAVIGGIGFDIRLSGKQFTPVFNEEDAVITGITSNLQYRTSNNWRLIGGIEFSYYLSRSLELYFEPSFQQYMQPLYSNDNDTGPGSIKMKAGLRFSF